MFPGLVPIAASDMLHQRLLQGVRTVQKQSAAALAGEAQLNSSMAAVRMAYSRKCTELASARQLQRIWRPCSPEQAGCYFRETPCPSGERQATELSGGLQSLEK
jgi:hypothetical protein